ncbi:MAG: phasin family protein [Chloroflexi bacterium]|nr:phasin family protein [Chloroflexota bacterium]MCI0575704.1 phasin family protein [Chloroflexota bacterium]MCI0648046.1 phasin family protein [Chloroflexota bacterium]MCI0725809.1 phasin family protein [Chloroflexota bacterium]
MAEKIEVTEEVVVENGYKPMLDLARKVLLAGIGAVALAQEEVEEFVNKLVERGEIAEKDGRKLIQDIMEKRKKKAEDIKSDAEGKLEKRMEEILDRMNVPSKADIDALSAKITALSKKVDELRKVQEKA